MGGGSSKHHYSAGTATTEVEDAPIKLLAQKSIPLPDHLKPVNYIPGEGDPNNENLKAKIVEAMNATSEMKVKILRVQSESQELKESKELLQLDLDSLCTQYDDLLAEREKLLRGVYEIDVDYLKELIQTRKLDILKEFLENKSIRDILSMDDIYFDKYGIRIRQELQDKGVSNDISLSAIIDVHESSNEIKMLAKYRLLDPAERDAVILHSCIAGLGTEDRLLIEILITRSNAELDEIQKKYFILYKKSFTDAIAHKASFQFHGHYHKFVSNILNGVRDESISEYDVETATVYATDLYQAFHKFTPDIGIVVNILSSINREKFVSINSVYSGRQLRKDIEHYVPGDLKLAILAHVTDKISYFVERYRWAIETDDAYTHIVRILGSITKQECRILRQVFDSTSDFTMVAMLKQDLGDMKDSLLGACLDLISDGYLLVDNVDIEDHAIAAGKIAVKKAISDYENQPKTGVSEDRLLEIRASDQWLKDEWLKLKKETNNDVLTTHLESFQTHLDTLRFQRAPYIDDRNVHKDAWLAVVCQIGEKESLIKGLGHVVKNLHILLSKKDAKHLSQIISYTSNNELINIINTNEKIISKLFFERLLTTVILTIESLRSDHKIKLNSMAEKLLGTSELASLVSVIIGNYALDSTKSTWKELLWTEALHDLDQRMTRGSDVTTVTTAADVPLIMELMTCWPNEEVTAVQLVASLHSGNTTETVIQNSTSQAPQVRQFLSACLSADHGANSLSHSHIKRDTPEVVEKQIVLLVKEHLNPTVCHLFKDISLQTLELSTEVLIALANLNEDEISLLQKAFYSAFQCTLLGAIKCHSNDPTDVRLWIAIRLHTKAQLLASCLQTSLKAYSVDADKSKRTICRILGSLRSDDLTAVCNEFFGMTGRMLVYRIFREMGFQNILSQSLSSYLVTNAKQISLTEAEFKVMNKLDRANDMTEKGRRRSSHTIGLPHNTFGATHTTDLGTWGAPLVQPSTSISMSIARKGSITPRAGSAIAQPASFDERDADKSLKEALTRAEFLALSAQNIVTSGSHSLSTLGGVSNVSLEVGEN